MLTRAQAQTPKIDVVARSLAATCANCHGTNGHAQGEMRALAGRPAHITVAQMQAFKAGAVSTTVMHQIAKGYSDDQIRLIAEWLAAQTPKP
ncbi:MAG TPA: cytochrome C [Burkholderiaceae bacterium]|nr:cytochrome C [Burkholderiaceae bacterium]